jgi:hypothetical protein
MTKNTNGGHDDHNQEKKEACLIILTPQGEWKHTFQKTDKVSEVLNATVQHFNFATNGKYELRIDPKEEMKPERTLVSYGLADGECHKVTFTDLGIAA